MGPAVRFLSALAPVCLLAAGAARAQSAGDVLITEIMYDSKGSTDEEWIELYNRRHAAIDVSGWRLGDSGTPGAVGSEGFLTIPSGTTIPAGGFIVIAEAPLGSITGEIVCAQSGSFLLANSGDNLWLLPPAPSTTLIDGSATVSFPDDCGTNVGDALERIDPSTSWRGTTSAWDPSSNLIDNAEIRNATPALMNSVFESSAPSEPGNLAAGDVTDTSATIAWTNASSPDLEGVLILRGGTEGVDPTGVPARGATYAAGSIIGADVVAFAGAGTSAPITYPLVTGPGWKVALFSFDEVRNYSAAALLSDPLPVELTAFSGRRVADGIELRWRTETETNSHGFRVQRAFEVHRWMDCGFVPGHGTVSTPNEYDFLDKVAAAALAERVWYRLIQVDRDGSERLFPGIEIRNTALPIRTTLEQNFPNPFNPVTNIRFYLPSREVVTLRIVDPAGREAARPLDLVTLESGWHLVPFDAGSLTGGVFTCVLEAGSALLARPMIFLRR